MPYLWTLTTWNIIFILFTNGITALLPSILSYSTLLYIRYLTYATWTISTISNWCIARRWWMMLYYEVLVLNFSQLWQVVGAIINLSKYEVEKFRHETPTLFHYSTIKMISLTFLKVSNTRTSLELVSMINFFKL